MLKLLSLKDLPWVRLFLKPLFWFWFWWIILTSGYTMGFEDGGLFIIDQVEKLMTTPKQQEKPHDTHVRIL